MTGLLGLLQPLCWLQQNLFSPSACFSSWLKKHHSPRVYHQSVVWQMHVLQNTAWPKKSFYIIASPARGSKQSQAQIQTGETVDWEQPWGGVLVMKCSTWPINVRLQPRKPTISWAASKKACPASWRMGYCPSTPLSWSSGAPKIRRSWTWLEWLQKKGTKLITKLE